MSLVHEPPLHQHSRIIGRHHEVFEQSSACWRGYVANWAVVDGKLYLTEIDGAYRLDGSEPLFADWYSGTLRMEACQSQSPGIAMERISAVEQCVTFANGIAVT